MDYGLRGPTVVVTGGASGIGRGVCELAADGGAHVAVLDLNETNVLATVQALKSKGSR